MGEKSNTQYLPLYRKYRPKNLQEVVGQDHIKKALANAINLNKISHAYLFTGPRGTGKTSIARILAKSLNCLQGPTLTPCEVCASCVDIRNSTPMDVIEIDAASNRSVEDARNILEKIQYVPTNGKFKIYIIDEVHMLTNQAFNALLKTLEEPPENVIFILATTEPHKVLETITSRCQRFDFRRITTDDIIGHLKHIAKIEKIKIEDEALFTIAKNAAGGMRDSLALLDQISVLDSSKTISSEDINRLLGRLSFDMLHILSENIIQSQPQAAIELLEKIYNSGNEPTQILLNLLGYLKNLLIVKNCNGDDLLMDLTQLNNSQIKILKKQSENIDTHQITFLIEKVIYYVKELKTTTNQHLWLEIAIIDLANLAQNTSLLALQERVSRLESGEKGSGKREVVKEKYNQPPIRPTNLPTQNKPPQANIKAEEKKEEPNLQTSNPPNLQEELPPMPVSKHEVKNPDGDLTSLWHSLLQNIASAPTAALLNQHATPIQISEQKVIIGCKETFLKLLNSDSKRPAIEESANKMFNKPVDVSIILASAEDFQSGEKKNPIIEDSAQNQAPKHIKKVTLPEIDSEPENIKELEPEISSEEFSEEDDFVEHELAKKVKKEEKFVPSDQVSMVIKLFDGKYID